MTRSKLVAGSLFGAAEIEARGNGVLTVDSSTATPVQATTKVQCRQFALFRVTGRLHVTALDAPIKMQLENESGEFLLPAGESLTIEKNGSVTKSARVLFRAYAGTEVDYTETPTLLK